MITEAISPLLLQLRQAPGENEFEARVREVDPLQLARFLGATGGVYAGQEEMINHTFRHPDSRGKLRVRVVNGHVLIQEKKVVDVLDGVEHAIERSLRRLHYEEAINCLLEAGCASDDVKLRRRRCYTLPQVSSYGLVKVELDQNLTKPDKPLSLGIDGPDFSSVAHYRKIYEALA